MSSLRLAAIAAELRELDARRARLLAEQAELLRHETEARLPLFAPAAPPSSGSSSPTNLMPPPARKTSTWKTVRPVLEAWDKPALLTIIKDIHAASEAARDLVNTRCRPAESAPAILEKARQKVVEQFFPKRGWGTLKLADARKAIRDYQKTTGNIPGTHLLLTYVENGAKFTAEFASTTASSPPSRSWPSSSVVPPAHSTRNFKPASTTSSSSPAPSAGVSTISSPTPSPPSKKSWPKRRRLPPPRTAGPLPPPLLCGSGQAEAIDASFGDSRRSAPPLHSPCTRRQPAPSSRPITSPSRVRTRLVSAALHARSSGNQLASASRANRSTNKNAVSWFRCGFSDIKNDSFKPRPAATASRCPRSSFSHASATNPFAFSSPASV